MSRRADSWDKRSHTAPKVLAQLTPSVTTPVTAYTVPKNTEVEIREIAVVNTANQDRDYAFYNDNDGSTYDSTTIVAEGSVTRDLDGDRILSLTLDNEGGTIGVETSSANDLTFTVWGVERPKR